MGKRKRIAAEAIKAERSTQSFAKLRNVPSSPRKMRYVVDLVRGMEVFKALGILHFTKKEAALKVEKLLRSAIANWEQKNGRKARIRKRSNHVTLYVDTIQKTNAVENA